MYLKLEDLVVDCTPMTPLFEFLYWIWSRSSHVQVERDHDSAHAFFL